MAIFESVLNWMPMSRGLSLLAAFLLGGACVFGLMLWQQSTPAATQSMCGVSLRDTDSQYEHIAPLLACSVSTRADSGEFEDLKNTFTEIVDQAVDQKQAQAVSVYYRELTGGHWTAVNLQDTYTPASLMKVPIMMAYLKRAESEPQLLQAIINVKVDPTPGQQQDIPPAEGVEVGKSYTVEELLRLMIVFSDNRAMSVLMNYLDTDLLDDIFHDLGIPTPSDQPVDYAVDPRLYSRFFRILYNATFLSDEMSEYALHLLTQAVYSDGLLAGNLPKTIQVAHKFGEVETVLHDGTQGHELHECGIVYTDSPYLLCVMTRGGLRLASCHRLLRG